MQNTGFNGGGRVTVRAEDVISKLKDDGDFDRLRLKIIRKLKENVEEMVLLSEEEMRNSIISMVKQSASLNRPGAETMKPRQLSDAIHQEIGDKLMSQISDGVWNVIRSADGMKTEIKETVQSVYDKLTNPEGKDNGESSSHKESPSIQNKLERSDAARAFETDGPLPDEGPNEPPGFGSTVGQSRNKNNQKNQLNSKGKAIEENKRVNSQDLQKIGHMDHGAPPGFSAVLEHKNLGDASDEDPDVPPGFG